MGEIRQIQSLQCRGPEGNLEKDVGVVILLKDTGNLAVKCPYYTPWSREGGSYYSCKASKSNCVFDSD